MATTIPTTTDFDAADFGCRANKIGINWANIDCPSVLACLDTNSDGKIDALQTGELAGPFNTADIATYSNASGDPEIVWSGGTAADPGEAWIAYPDGTKVQIKSLAGASDIDGLTDVDTTTAAPAVGETLKWAGTNWVPSAVTVDLPGTYTSDALANAAAVAAGDGVYRTDVNGCETIITVIGGTPYQTPLLTTGAKIFTVSTATELADAVRCAKKLRVGPGTIITIDLANDILNAAPIRIDPGDPQITFRGFGHTLDFDGYGFIVVGNYSIIQNMDIVGSNSGDGIFATGSAFVNLQNGVSVSGFNRGIHAFINSGVQLSGVVSANNNVGAGFTASTDSVIYSATNMTSATADGNGGEGWFSTLGSFIRAGSQVGAPAISTNNGSEGFRADYGSYIDIYGSSVSGNGGAADIFAVFGSHIQDLGGTGTTSPTLVNTVGNTNSFIAR